MWDAAARRIAVPEEEPIVSVNDQLMLHVSTCFHNLDCYSQGDNPDFR